MSATTRVISDAELDDFANDYPVFVDEDPAGDAAIGDVAPPNAVPSSTTGDAYRIGARARSTTFGDRGSMGPPSSTNAPISALKHTVSMPPTADHAYDVADAQQNDRLLAQRARSLGHGLSDHQRASTQANLTIGQDVRRNRWVKTRNTMSMRTYYDRAVAEHKMLYGTRDASELMTLQFDDNMDVKKGRCWYTPESRFRRGPGSLGRLSACASSLANFHLHQCSL